MKNLKQLKQNKAPDLFGIQIVDRGDVDRGAVVVVITARKIGRDDGANGAAGSRYAGDVGRRSAAPRMVRFVADRLTMFRAKRPVRHDPPFGDRGVPWAAPHGVAEAREGSVLADRGADGGHPDLIGQVKAHPSPANFPPFGQVARYRRFVNPTWPLRRGRRNETIPESDP